MPPRSRTVHSLVEEWRSSTPRSQWTTLSLLLVLVTGCFAVSLPFYSLMPVSTYFVWLVLGMLLLRYRQLTVLVAYTVLGAFALALLDGLHDGAFGSARASGMVALAVGGALILYQSSRQRSGLPVPLGGAMLADLRDRLQRQGTVPPLPHGWHCETAMVAAHDVGYAGDFMVARLDDEHARLEMVLVDVVGKGVAAGTTPRATPRRCAGTVRRRSGRSTRPAARPWGCSGGPSCSAAPASSRPATG